MVSSEMGGNAPDRQETEVNNLADLDRDDVQVIAAQSFLIASRSATSPVWVTSYHASNL